MSEAECPYCGHYQEISHDDGYGYDENYTYEQECHSCEKVFSFTVEFSISYNTGKAPCMNGEPHSYKPTATAPKWWTKMRCEWCDEEREPTQEEKEKHDIPPLPEHYR